MSSGNQLILVDDPEATFSLERRAVHADAMLYGRPQKTGPASPFGLRYLASQSRSQWEHFNPEFVAALPLLEAYSQGSKPAPGQQLTSLLLRSNRIDDPEQEEIVRRHDFGSDLLMLFINLPAVNQTPDFMGVMQEYVDLNDDPWLEWVHPPQNFVNAFQPFRQYFLPPPVPLQWEIGNRREPDWYGQSDSYEEHDTINRQFSAEDWVVVVRGVFPPGPFPAVQLELFQIEPTLGSITLIWSASPGAAGYRLYTNGVPATGFMPATQQQLTITGLVLGTAYTYSVVAVNGYGVDASMLSNTIMYEHGVSEVMAIFNLTPPNTGL